MQNQSKGHNRHVINKLQLYQPQMFSLMLSHGQCVILGNVYTPPTEGIGISWEVEGSMRPKNLKKCMKLNWNFQRGEEVLEKIPPVGGGMDIFWNYTIIHQGLGLRFSREHHTLSYMAH